MECGQIPASGTDPDLLLQQQLERKAKLREEIIEGAFNGERISLSRVRSRVPPGTMTIAMLRERTGLTESETRRLIVHGTLKPVSYNHLGWALYDDTTIENLRNKPPGSDPKKRRLPSLTKKTVGGLKYSAAEAFAVQRLIENGTPLPTIAIDLEMHPTLIATIRDDYVMLGEGIFLTKKDVIRIDELEGRLEGIFPVRHASALCRLLEMAARRQTCACGVRRKRVCLSCARKPLEEQEDAALAEPAD